MNDFLYITSTLGTGGQERQLYYLLSAMDRSKYTASVIVWNYSETDKYVELIKALNVPIIGYSPAESTIKKYRNFRKYVAGKKPVVIHSFTFYLNLAVWYAGVLKSTVSFGGLRNTYELYLKDVGFLTGFLCGLLPYRTISNNHTGARELKKYFKPLNKKVYVVTNRLNLDEYPFSYSYSDDEIRTVTVGRFYPLKRWDILLEVLYILKQKGYQFTHYILGKGPLEKEIKDDIKRKNLEDYVIMPGEVKNVNEYLTKSRFMIHTADFEGTPNVIMEAMASGRAIVSTCCGDTPYLIKDGENGYITNTGDVNLLVEKAEVLFKNPELAIRMGMKGRELAETNFSLNRLVHDTLEVYKNEGVKI